MTEDHPISYCVTSPVSSLLTGAYPPGQEPNFMSDARDHLNERESGFWPRTSWSRIELLNQVDADSDDKDIYEDLIQRYWPAVYAYVRSTGRSLDESSDLTQGFICDIILDRQLFHVANRQRGRFRSLLLTALKNYIRERYRYEARMRRGGRAVLIPLDSAEQVTQKSRDAKQPDEVFHAEWAGSLIRHVLDMCQRACRQDGLDTHWEIFEARVVRPSLTGEAAVSYDTLILRMGLPDVAQAANMMVTAKRRFSRYLQDEISKTVDEPTSAPGELSALLAALEGRS